MKNHVFKKRNLFYVCLLVLPCFSCNSMMERSRFKDSSKRDDQIIQQINERAQLLDYNFRTQMDSSSFGAWILVEDSFVFHPDFGVQGKNGIIQYFGNRYSENHDVDSSLWQKEEGFLHDEFSSQIEKAEIKEKTTKWIPPYWFGFLLIVLIGGAFWVKRRK